MNTCYVFSHDVGTSSVKTALVDQRGNVHAQEISAYSFQYPKPGRVEQQPEDYWNGVVQNTRKIVARKLVDTSHIIGIVFSTQAMGIIPLDDQGRVLHPNITWVDGRAEVQALQLMRKLGGKTLFKYIAGVAVTGKDVIPKLRWMKQHLPEIYAQTTTILDVNGYLKYKATGERVAEWSGACSYGFDLKKKDWERLVFKGAGVDVNKLPRLVRSTDLIGTLTTEAAAQLNLPPETKVFGGCDDTQSAAMGSGASQEGQAHIYLGTSAWVGVSTRKNLKHKSGAYCLQSADPAMNLIVGITESAGSNLDWLIDKFYHLEKRDPKIADIYHFINTETEGVPDGCDHLIFTPWLLGERCPVNTTTTRGTLFNLSLEHSRGHMVKALLEGIGYNLRWIMENFERDFGLNIRTIRAIGGGSVNDQWMQGIANITGKTVETTTQPKMAGAVGAATCAFVGAGIFSDFSEASGFIRLDKTFVPQEGKKSTFDTLFKTYQQLYFNLSKVYQQSNGSRFSN